MKTALTIAGSDPTSGAGIQADLKVFHHFGIYGLSAVAALTAQNTCRVTAISGVDVKLLEEQLNALISDIRPDALKTGMLLSGNSIAVVARIVKGYDLYNLTVDPVIRSSTGAMLIEEGALDVMREELFPLARVVTPNIYEATALSGINIIDEGDMERAAIELKKTGAEAVIITGGHFQDGKGQGPEGKETLDLFFDGNEFHRIQGTRIKGEYHGTGCVFSAALTALMARGLSVKESAQKAREFMDIAISHALVIGRGMRVLNI